MSSNNATSAELLAALRELPWAGPGPIIRELRRGHGLRLKDLAAAAGISIGYLSRLERSQLGGDNPSMANLEALARALAVPITVLLPPASGTDEPNTVVGLVGREVLLAIQYGQPVTLPVIERRCSHAGTRAEIAAALVHLVETGMVVRLPPTAPGRPIFHILRPDRSL